MTNSSQNGDTPKKPPDSPRAERRLAAIVESSDDAIVSKDLNGIITSWNRAAERLFGYTAAEVIGESITIIIPKDRLQEEDTVLAAIRRGDKVDHFETIRRRKDGTFIPISLTVSPIRDTDGTVVGASKIARDISERIEAERERARLLAELREASRLKDEFLATLSHELRTPLNAILGYARMLRSGLLPATKRDRAVEVIERNASALAQIVEDVLDVSRITAGKVRLNVQPLDLSEVIRNAIASVTPAADARGIRLDFKVESQAALICGDPDRLQQVLWNLLSNAVKFTGRGGRVSVQLRHGDGDVELCVTDTGIGISKDFLPFLFDRFRQGDARTTREHGGLGIGLAIARHFVEMHGGTITASSPGEGQGATFTIKLPTMAAVFDVPEAQEQTPFGKDSGGVPVVNLSGVSVLVVDDDADALKLVRELLEAAGAHVITVGSGTEALNVLPSVRPDVLVADVGLPRMDGYELIERVRAAEDGVRNVPAAAVTAYARSEDRAKALRSGFQMHLSKPIDPSELMEAVASLARRASVN